MGLVRKTAPSRSRLGNDFTTGKIIAFHGRGARVVLAASVAITVAAILIAVGGAVICEGALRVPRRAIPASPLTVLTPEQAQPIGEWRSVEIPAADGAVLRGWLLLSRASNGGYIIALHGIADSRIGQLGLACLFLRNHYAVLLPDSRGHGASGGDLVTYGLRESADVRRWYDWLKRTEHPRNIYGFGESLGGSILLQSLPITPGFSAVAAECPYASFRRIAEYRIAQSLPVPCWLAEPGAAVLVRSGFVYARWKYGLDFRKVSAADAISHTNVPILLIHGMADIKTPAINSRILAAGNPARVTLWLVPGAQHTGAYQTAPAEFEGRVIGWFSGHSRATAAAGTG